jgi:hypothetical protein
MSGARVGLLSLAAVLSAVTLGCGGGGGGNLPPAISSFTAQPTGVPPGGSTQLTVVATDPESTTLQYEYLVISGGGVVRGTGASVTYTAPVDALPGTQATIRVTVTDTGNRSATADAVVRVLGSGFGGIVIVKTIDPAGTPIRDVRASIGAVSAQGNEQGYLSLGGIQAPASVRLVLQCDGYLTATRRLVVPADAPVSLLATLLPVGHAELPDVRADVDVTYRGAGAHIAARSLRSAAGATLSTARVTLTPSFASDPGFVRSLPGPFLATATPTALRVYGMLQASVAEEDGGAATLAPGASVGLSLPIDPAADPGTPTVPRWRLSVAEAAWVRDGEWTRDDGGAVYRTEVTRWETWAMATQYASATVHAVVTDENTLPLAGVAVTAVGDGAAGWLAFAVTGADGTASLPCPPGVVAHVTAQKGTIVIGPADVVPPDAGASVDIPMTVPGAPASIILTWGAKPADLDSHLFLPTEGLDRVHVFHGNRGSATAVPFAALDTDDRNGYGPEIISVRRLFAGTYSYFVHNYTGQTAGNTIEASGATVTLNSALGTQSWFVPGTNPASATNSAWHVFDLVVATDGGLSLQEPSNFVTEERMYELGGVSMLSARTLKPTEVVP